MSTSLIIIAYNRLDQLKLTLPSIHFEHVDETILVDDGSEDGVGDWIANQYPNIRVIHPEGEKTWRNPARARNLGVAAAQGDIVIVQDAECLHISDAIRQVQDHLEKNPKRQWVVTTDAPIYEQYGQRPHVKNPAYRYILIGTWREDWISIGGMNEFYTQWGNEDVEFETRCLQLGYDFVLDTKIEIKHLAHHSTEGDQARWKFECEFHQWYSDRLKAGLGDPRLIWRH